ncbi:MAG: hypothetical protein M0036_26990 [Desulfobacteraceae bacterium]|nr:hypothetical protein [Desulfobacteraceae bacterium]
MKLHRRNQFYGFQQIGKNDSGGINLEIRRFFDHIFAGERNLGYGVLVPGSIDSYDIQQHYTVVGDGGGVQVLQNRQHQTKFLLPVNYRIYFLRSVGDRKSIFSRVINDAGGGPQIRCPQSYGIKSHILDIRIFMNSRRDDQMLPIIDIGKPNFFKG